MINLIHNKVKFITTLTLKSPSHQPGNSKKIEGEYIVYILPDKRLITKNIVNDAQSIN